MVNKLDFIKSLGIKDFIIILKNKSIILGKHICEWKDNMILLLDSFGEHVEVYLEDIIDVQYEEFLYSNRRLNPMSTLT